MGLIFLHYIITSILNTRPCAYFSCAPMSNDINSLESQLVAGKLGMMFLLFTFYAQMSEWPTRRAQTIVLAHNLKILTNNVKMYKQNTLLDTAPTAWQVRDRVVGLGAGAGSVKGGDSAEKWQPVEPKKRRSTVHKLCPKFVEERPQKGNSLDSKHSTPSNSSMTRTGNDNKLRPNNLTGFEGLASCSHMEQENHMKIMANSERRA